MKPFTFEDLPNILGTLSLRVENIERLLKEIKNKPSEPENADLMTIIEASKLIKLSVPTLYSKVCRNEIPVHKQGKRLYFLRSELLDWIKSGRIKTIAEIQQEADQRFKRRD